MFSIVGKQSGITDGLIAAAVVTGVVMAAGVPASFYLRKKLW